MSSVSTAFGALTLFLFRISGSHPRKSETLVLRSRSVHRIQSMPRDEVFPRLFSPFQISNFDPDLCLLPVTSDLSVSSVVKSFCFFSFFHISYFQFQYHTPPYPWEGMSTRRPPNLKSIESPQRSGYRFIQVQLLHDEQRRNLPGSRAGPVRGDCRP